MASLPVHVNLADVTQPANFAVSAMPPLSHHQMKCGGDVIGHAESRTDASPSHPQQHMSAFDSDQLIGVVSIG